MRAGPKKLAFAVALFFAPFCFTQSSVTPQEIQTVKAKLNLATPYFQKVWSRVFASRGIGFRPPAIVPFSEPRDTPCGKLQPGNGFYCAADNNIYLDAAFLAGLMKSTAAHTKTDGDYAAIVVAAHEFGHLVAKQLGSTARLSFNEEQAADCFAGAVTQQARLDGYLEKGDLEEGRYSLVISGDLTFPGSMGRLINQGMADSHGGPNEREDAFNRGYYVGPAACTDKLGLPGIPPGGQTLYSDNFSSTRPGSGEYCAWSGALNGLTLTNVARGDSCELRFPGTSSLPLHFRIEVTASQTKGNPNRGYGILFGPAAAGDILKAHWIFMVRADGSYEFATRSTFLTPVLGSYFAQGAVLRGYNALNRLTMDVHRSELDTTILGYVNGRFVGLVKASAHEQGQAGLFLEMPGMEGFFSNLRVVGLSE